MSAAVVKKKSYALRIPTEIERQLRKCRAAVSAAVRAQLQAIVEAASVDARPLSVNAGPPQRFYVFGDHRVSYEVDAGSCSVIVLELRTGLGK